MSIFSFRNGRNGKDKDKSIDNLRDILGKMSDNAVQAAVDNGFSGEKTNANAGAFIQSITGFEEGYQRRGAVSEDPEISEMQAKCQSSKIRVMATLDLNSLEADSLGADSLGADSLEANSLKADSLKAGSGFDQGAPRGDFFDMGGTIKEERGARDLGNRDEEREIGGRDGNEDFDFWGGKDKAGTEEESGRKGDVVLEKKGNASVLENENKNIAHEVDPRNGNRNNNYAGEELELEFGWEKDTKEQEDDDMAMDFDMEEHVIAGEDGGRGRSGKSGDGFFFGFSFPNDNQVAWEIQKGERAWIVVFDKTDENFKIVYSK